MYKLNKFSHPSCTIYTGSPFFTMYCSNTTTLITYKAINFSQPPYLSSLVKQIDLTRCNHLSISSSKPNKCSGLHSFAVAAPTEWNKLPQAIRTVKSFSDFRKQLKRIFSDWHIIHYSLSPLLMQIWILTFLDLDYPFLDISALEDVYINFGTL